MDMRSLWPGSPPITHITRRPGCGSPPQASAADGVIASCQGMTPRGVLSVRSKGGIRPVCARGLSAKKLERQEGARKRCQQVEMSCMGFDDESRKTVWAIWVSPERAKTGLSARATRLEIGPVVDVLSVEDCSSGQFMRAESGTKPSDHSARLSCQPATATITTHFQLI